ncbi:MAG: hypothetical protein FJW86_11055 [Actinobacteria bacterium]|nr:hypothetical protein [Actinomycetota bacterium]
MIGTRRARPALAVVIVATTVWLPAVHAGAGTPDRAERLLKRAREVSAEGSYAGIVEVTWRDDTGTTQSQRTIAQGVEGTFVIGMGVQSSHGVGDERFTKGEGDPTHAEAGSGAKKAPAPGAAWELEVVARRRVAYRPAVVIAARDDDGRTRAKFAVDRETGQLLRRAVLNRSGDVVRVVEFVAINTTDDDSPRPQTEVAVGVGGVGEAPVAIDDVPSRFTVREEMGGYRLLGRYQHPDGGIQHYYGDGLFTLSVFQSEGVVAWDALPDGDPASIEGLRSRVYSTASGTIVVWGQDGLVMTVIGDGPRDQVMAAVADVSGRADEGSWLDDAVDFVLGPFDWE